MFIFLKIKDCRIILYSELIKINQSFSSFRVSYIFVFSCPFYLIWVACEMFWLACVLLSFLLNLCWLVGSFCFVSSSNKGFSACREGFLCLKLVSSQVKVRESSNYLCVCVCVCVCVCLESGFCYLKNFVFVWWI